MDKAAGRDMKIQMYAVQQIYALRYHRFEVNPYFGITMNDQFVLHPGPGLGLNFYITNVLAVGVNGNFYQGLNSNSSFNFQTSSAARVGEFACEASARKPRCTTGAPTARPPKPSAAPTGSPPTWPRRNCGSTWSGWRAAPAST
jgi:hypothetical protein